MKRIVYLLMVLAVFATGCKKKEEPKSTALNYNDKNPIVMAFSGSGHSQNIPAHYFDYKIQVSSDYDISYRAINPDDREVITVSSDGYIHGKNIGEAKVKMSNGYENKTVDVKVDLFIEPTFEFGCPSSKIRALYGKPYYSAIVDTILVYQYTRKHGYSAACGEMDIYFYNGGYYEADLYIMKLFEDQIDDYLNENFVYDTIYGDTLSIYRHKINEDIHCGMFDTHNQWNEYCLFYYQITQNDTEASFLKSVPRSSKLRY